MQEHTQVVKNILATAAGPNAVGDDGWHAAGIERLYFQHPTDVRQSGFVEVRRNEDNTEYVRLEMHVPPEVAADLIKQVTGSITSLIMPWSNREETPAPAVDIPGVTSEQAERLVSIAADADKGLSTGFELGRTEALIAEEDRARSEELNRLIAEQGVDADEDEVEPLDFEKVG